ncbi:DMT family transporter [Haematomicrobium sanguinis]|uniref:DMT family transporter n=1 Tax=Haematomicrobium sanguinis TaxID=479106 RepID=UPI00047E2D34|nr:SMR family transporter [Haematomicrobium sanguinis]
MKKWLFLSIAIISEVSATLCLRGAMDQPWLYAGVILGYGIAFVALALVLRQGMSIGVAYGIWAASGVALTAIIAAIVFGDPFTWVIALGIAVIIAGVLLVEFGSQKAHAQVEERVQ